MTAAVYLEELSSVMAELGPALAARSALIRVTPFRKLNSLRPALKLPSELLGDIFLMVCLSATEYGPIQRGYRDCITSTCHVWREVAISTTALWSSISLRYASGRAHYHLEGDDVPPDIVVPVPQLLALEIQRSKDHPLHLSINTFGGSMAWDALVDLIQPVVWRSKTIRISNFSGNFWPDTLLRIRDSPLHFPYLKSFRAFQSIPYPTSSA